MTLPKLLIATRNPGKKREIRQFLADLSLEMVFPDDVGIYESPQELKLETADTFDRPILDNLLDLATGGVATLFAEQRKVLG